MTKKILFVDDSLQLLSAIRRRLRKEINLSTAASGQEALNLLKEEGPFAVLVTDQNMPGMNGLELLKAAKEIAPDMQRIMMTGQADEETSQQAINDGHVFKILSKPCSPEDVLTAVRSALKRFESKVNERTSAEATLLEGLTLMSEVIAFKGGNSAGAAPYTRAWAKQLAPYIGDINPFELECAVILSGLGKLSLPEELQSKIEASEQLTDEEYRLVEKATSSANRVLDKTPMFKDVADAIQYQNKGFDGSGWPNDDVWGNSIPKMARTLKILNDLSAHAVDANGNFSLHKSFGELKRNIGAYDPQLLEQFEHILIHEKHQQGDPQVHVGTTVEVTDLVEDDIIEEDIRTRYGSLVLTAGTVLTPHLLGKIKQTNDNIGLNSPIQILRRGVNAAA
ncbi:response regulator [Kordiimonas sp. SCSIO 12603]|uniref:HD domain-containing phosphohydrolase n=1 Tax=Kordiimonas sp. SCSIO 12603 TaxID=2829596 RepID=UPI002105949B|nr:HD domain-containing phosphohydrolase [Kordiimonas sp. SCSIO 12603]UTW60169.1 response regulator [Kordiimonas sp. SCSIO 12603]